MQFTGLELTRSRDIYTQNLNFGWALDCQVDNTTGRYEFGVTGAAGALAFTLQSGRILAGNTFLHNYAANERFYLECQIATNSYNVIKDDVPLVMGASKASGDFTKLYFSRQQPTLFADFDFHASGQNRPNVTIDDIGYLLTTGQRAVSGLYRNAGSYPVRVFSSNALQTQGLSFGELAGTVAKSSNAPFAFTGDFTNFNFAKPIVVGFETTFQDAAISFTIIDARSQSSFVYFEQIPNFDFDGNGVLNKTLSYSNISGGFVTDGFNAALTFSLDYVSGSGIVVGGDSYTTTGYGNFVESGLLTGLASTITGQISISQFAWATGLASGTFTGIGTGYATGEGYSGIATGLYSGLATGLILNGSGSFIVGTSTGVGFGFSSSPSNESYATGAFGTTLEEAIFAYDQDNGSPYVYGYAGSGSPRFGNIHFGETTVYYGSGEDILWALSGMEDYKPGFGITGYMSGKKLYLAGVQTELNGPGEFNNVLYLDGKYPGCDRALTGAWESGTPTGYIDLSSLLYTDDDDIRIIGYNTFGFSSLSCIYTPPVKYWPENATYRFFGVDNDYRYIAYSTAAGLASGINAYEGIEVFATDIGNKVYITANYNGVEGNDIGMYGYTSPILSIAGVVDYLIGGSPSTPATGCVEILPVVYDPSVSTQMQDYGAFGMFSNTGNWGFDAYRFDSQGNGQEVCYYLNASDLAFALTGSFVGTVFMNGYAEGSDVLNLVSVLPGEAGNTGYYYSPEYDYVTLAGGGGAASSFAVIPVGTYTGYSDQVVLGSGSYSEVISQSGVYYYKTFTGIWDLLTGTSQAGLASTKLPGNFTETQMGAIANLPPNSQVYFQITHTADDTRPDGARLVISGANVLNGISEILSQP